MIFEFAVTIYYMLGFRYYILSLPFILYWNRELKTVQWMYSELCVHTPTTRFEEEWQHRNSNSKRNTGRENSTLVDGASIAKDIEIDQKMSSLTCDYLVIGAGASAMAFVDELVNSSKKLTVVLVDKRAKPGETIKWESFSMGTSSMGKSLS